uniref:CRAL/TRIO N-terminal domain-containing protein n=1 Tax=Chloropicon primus TaxID=1764295 RepID=A0A7S2SZE2_9CHLO|mmetsp:Transcript_1368/g.3929  ORF Transcript_1368/g.3929 Transcript_1368/m.3929 type:complete len:314 (+) Transcript_1368:298-1239(+)
MMAAAARRDDDGSSSSKSTTTRSSWLPSSKASASRGSSLGTSVDILRQATLKQVKGSVKRLSVILGNTFVALRDSVRSFALKHPEADHFFKTLDFRRMVYDDVSVLDAVDHAAMLKGRTMGKATLSRATIAKFLIARKYDLGKAHEMLAGYLEWRLTHSCVEDEQVAKSLEQDKVFVLRNTDKGGHVCVVIAVRKHLMHDVTLEETTRFIVYVIDKVAQTFLRKKKSMDKLTCIIDLQDIGYKNLGELDQFFSPFLLSGAFWTEISSLGRTHPPRQTATPLRPSSSSCRTSTRRHWRSWFCGSRPPSFGSCTK